jgi:type II secretory pathway pseudopilin PulG
MKPLSLSVPSLLPRARLAVGFTLIEIAVVVFIGTMLLTAGLAMFKARLDAAQVEVTQKKQDAIKQALIAYLARNKRLPCPDNNNDGREDRNPAAPYACYVPVVGTTQNFGGVPYVDLGLERSAVLDGWENYIRYVMSPNWRFTYVSPVTDPTTMSAAPPSPTVFSADAAFVPKLSTGLIAVYVSLSPPVPPVLDPCNGLLAPSNNGPVVALVSHGKNGFYARNVSGNTNTGPAGPSEETQNATPTSDPGVPAYCPWNLFRVVKHDANDTFDDVILTISESEFTAPLSASGASQGSPDWALSKANDFVIGNIPGIRSACPIPPTPPVYALTPCTGFYYTLPTSITFPSEVAAYGVTYARGTSSTAPNPLISTIDSVYPIGTDIAYSLAAPGGTPRTVTVGELRGILTRGAGFN